MKLVIIALVLAIPIAAYAMEEWLNTFAYHVALKWLVFIAAAFAAVAIATATIS